MKKSIVLVLCLMLIGAVVSFAQNIIPSPLPADYSSITVEPGLPGEMTTAGVSIMLPDGCTFVSAWLPVVRDENAFYIEVETSTIYGVFCAQVIGSASNGYELGELEQGEYTVTVTNYGISMKTVTFVVVDEPGETPDPTPIITDPPPAYDCGDYNEDGAVNIIDALLIAQSYVGLSSGNMELGDVNNDGVLDILDALLVARYVVGQIESLDCGIGGID